MKVNKYNIFYGIGFFILLFYPFNVSLWKLIYGNNVIVTISFLIGIVCILLGSMQKTYKYKDLIPKLIITAIAILIILFRNYDLNNDNYLIVITYVVYAMLILILTNNIKWMGVFKKVLKIFMYEHIFFTWFFYFFPSLYVKYMPTILAYTSSNSKAPEQFLIGNMTGITNHYSTNAIYLSISTILFFVDFLDNKNKKSIITFILSLGALLLTGKRGHLLFTILTCIGVYILKNSKNLIKTMCKVLIFIMIGIGIFALASEVIPGLTITIERFLKFSDSDDITNGRINMYKYAITLWNNNKIIGIGWGAYKYYFLSYANRYYDAHNIYIQLLTETGIIGCIFFISCFAILFFKTINYQKKVELYDIEEKEKKNIKFMNLFSIGMQLFFLMYGITGCPLYSTEMCLMYGISVASTFAIENYLKTKTIKK